jgi:hypothetical protein
MERVKNPETSSQTLAALMRAFVDLEMLKLRLKMKPAPKPVDVTPKAKPAPSIAPTDA